MAEVVTFKGKPEVVVDNKPEPVKIVIERLEQMLEKAKRGELIAFIYAYVENDMGRVCGWRAPEDDTRMEGRLSVGLIALNDMWADHLRSEEVTRDDN